MSVFPILLSLTLKSVCVMGAAWLASCLLRRASAATRHLVWTCAAAALLALPLVTALVPAWPVATGITDAGLMFRADATSQPDAGHALARATAPVVVPAAGVALPDWRRVVVLLWAVGIAVGLIRMLRAWVAVRRARREARPFCSAGFSLPLGVEVLETRSGSMPLTCGIRRPAVLLPAEAASWTEERRRVVLLHELAHVRRGDAATHIMARTVLLLHWWNPLAWLSWREFVKEEERAADDEVLNAGTSPTAYAAHLLDVARRLRPAPASGIAMAQASQLEGRLKAILNAALNRNALTKRAVFASAVLALCMLVPLAALKAQSDQPALPADVDATIKVALAEKNHQMLESAAAAFEKQRKYDTAQKLLESAAAIHAEVSGKDSADYGLALLKIADLESRRGQREFAAPLYSQAATLLAGKPEAARALVGLGRLALVRREFTSAFDYFQRAQLADPAHPGVALMWQAVVREREDKPDEAETLYDTALAAQDPNSPEAAVTMRLHALLLRSKGNVDQANSLEERAAALSKKAVAQPLSTGVFKMGNVDSAPQLVSKVEPRYSNEARAAKLAGMVLLSIEVGTDGRAHNIQVLRSLGLGLDEEAVDAVSQWVFKPGMKDGAPVTVAANVEVNFRLL